MQFHFSHAENVSSKLPKWTLFHLHVHLFNYSSTRYTSRRICFVSCLYISTYLKMFLARFINRLAASLSYRTLSYLGLVVFFFSPVGAVIRDVWLALKSAEVRTRESRLQAVKYSRQKLDRRYHHLAVNLLSKNRQANRLSMEAQYPSLMTSDDIWKNVALSFLASGFLYINSETSV